ncbi:MAG: hypothetical protein L0G09_15675, partial [Acinetobacter sp.]|nr:hypothetical protein [Acinetobacter sp.]
GKYYFDSVQIKNNPLNEAAFLGRNSNVYGGYAYRTIESQDYLTYDPLSTSTFYELARAKDEKDLHYFTGGLEYFHEQFYLNGEDWAWHSQNKKQHRFKLWFSSL